MKIYSFEHCLCNKNSDKEILAAVSEYLGCKFDNGVEVWRDEYGKPHVVGVENVYVSVTHSENLLLVAVSEKEVGIDAEKVARRVKNPMALAKRYFCDDEIEFLGDNPTQEAFCDMWVKKEAVSKLLGKGVACMKDESIFSDRIKITAIMDYDGFIVYCAAYCE